MGGMIKHAIRPDRATGEDFFIIKHDHFQDRRQGDIHINA
jgi:hypothetical protein